MVTVDNFILFILANQTVPMDIFLSNRRGLTNRGGYRGRAKGAMAPHLAKGAPLKCSIARLSIMNIRAN